MNILEKILKTPLWAKFVTIWILAVPIVWKMYDIILLNPKTADGSWIPEPIFNVLLTWSSQSVNHIAYQILLIELVLLLLLVWWIDTLK